MQEILIEQQQSQTEQELIQMLAIHGGTIKDGVLLLSEPFGNGYIKTLYPYPGLSIMIQEFSLLQPLTLKRPANQGDTDQVVFSFRNVSHADHEYSKDVKRAPVVQLSTSSVSLDIRIPIGVQISNVVIKVNLSFLQDLLRTDDSDPLLRQITELKRSFLFESAGTPELWLAAERIMRANAGGALNNYYYRLQTQTVIYHLMVELLGRNQVKAYPVSQEDANKLYSIRDAVIKDLCSPPVLKLLAREHGMSESKMSRMFMQVFGNSVYDYFQKARMREAAYLIREEKKTVSQAGYELGFINLSHFTRLFERHNGIKPKKYSLL